VYEVTVEASFAAAHRLRGYEGACERLHGHNYRVVVAVRAEEVGPVGMLIDFKILKGELGKVIDVLDHHCLNDDIPDFAPGTVNPTAENIARWVFERLAESLPPETPPARVTVWESEKSAATYFPSPGA
jgi:6-pyruvoyltetrahydropterin/6-carboxytetrahydropterin synthase